MTDRQSRPTRTEPAEAGIRNRGRDVTIRDVAATAGVAIATVSRVVHGHPKVGPALRQRVEEAMSALGYQPDAAAQSMRTRSTRTIACAVRDSSIPELATFTRAAESVIRQAGYTLILANTDEDPAQELDLIKVLSRRRVDGLLMTKSDDDDPAVDRALKELGIPVVFIDRYSVDAAASVVIDHKVGMQAAVRHLVSLGHRRIALVTGRPTMRPALERLNAFREALTESDVTWDADLVAAVSFDGEQSFESVSRLFALRPRPTAIIAGGMALLSPVLRAIREQGLSVADDISVIAGCDSELAELATPPITAIRWDVPAWGRCAANLLLESLAAFPDKVPPDRAAGRTVVLSTDLVVRQSCKPVRVWPSADGIAPEIR